MTTKPPITVSYSELDTFRQCPLKHRLAYVLRWSKERTEGSALARGTAWHTILATHYHTLQTATFGMTRTQILAASSQILDECQVAVSLLLADPNTGEMSEQQELLAWMYAGYVQYHGVDPDWRILGIEMKIRVPLLNEGGRVSRFEIKGVLDLVVRSRSTGRMWIIDHKTGKDLPRDKDLDLDDQFGLYEWMWNRLNPDGRIQGTIHNAARTYRTVKPAALDTRFLRTPMSRTKSELDILALDAYRAARAAYGEHRDRPYSSPDPRQCGWKCDFRDVHLLERKGVPIESTLADFGFTQYQPKEKK